MLRPRSRVHKQGQTCILTNSKSGGYQSGAIRKLLDRFRQANQSYTILEPTSPTELHRLAKAACEQKLAELGVDAVKRGAITSLVACGGDGTVNLVARAALESDIPLGIFPLGTQNNIAKSYYGEKKLDEITPIFFAGKTRKMDCAFAGDQPFFAAIGLGLLPILMNELRLKGRPRFGLGWGRLGTNVAEKTKPEQITVKVDTFRFDMKPRFLSIHVLPFAAGLPFSPVSGVDDGKIEVLFDHGIDTKVLGQFIKETAAKKYIYGAEIRMYRAAKLSLQQVKGRQLYLDGELLAIPSAVMEITMSEKKLRVLC